MPAVMTLRELFEKHQSPPGGGTYLRRTALTYKRILEQTKDIVAEHIRQQIRANILMHQRAERKNPDFAQKGVSRGFK